jgi:hypothetical protein
VLVDSECRIKGVIDWENALVGPWEIIEMIKELTVVPPALDGAFYREKQSDVIAERKGYIQAIKDGERAMQLDNRLSETLDNGNTQNLAHTFWLFSDGRIGYYSNIIDLLEKSTVEIRTKGP